MIFDGEQLTDLMEPLGLGWRERRERELALMADLVPLLNKRAQGRDISGLNAYEQGRGAMTADNPSPFVPKLRFPEFRDGPRWDLLTLSSASDVNPSNDGLPESFIYIDLESVMLIERKQITRRCTESCSS